MKDADNHDEKGNQQNGGNKIMVGRGKKKFINEKDKPIEPCSLVARPQKTERFDYLRRTTRRYPTQLME